MNTARIMEDGDLRLPPEVVDRLHAKPGDSVGIEVDVDGSIRLHPKPLSPEEVFGCLSHRTTAKGTIEEIDDAVAEAFRRDEL